jgi:hypothetical protein
MIYLNATLVLIIAYQVTKLTMEYRQMGQARNTKKLISGQSKAA